MRWLIEKLYDIGHFIKQTIITAGKVIKHIEFTDKGKDFHYTEQVQLLGLPDFQELLNEHFHILHTFGNYELDAFDPSPSLRLILIAQKK